MTNAQRVSSERKESTEMVSEAGGEGEMEEGGGRRPLEDPQNGSEGPALCGRFVENSTADF